MMLPEGFDAFRGLQTTFFVLLHLAHCPRGTQKLKRIFATGATVPPLSGLPATVCGVCHG